MADDLIGRKIGGYEILELIGHGGMATVYRAQQVSMNRIVAVKVLPRQFLNDETYMQRFNREVKIVAQLEHRSIVPVHDYGEAEGQPFIVMRYMSGGSVDDLLRSGALKLDQIVRILDQIAPALDYAHGKGVLHRDLKPSNVLMDDDGGAYLTDFGIARLMADESTVTITTQGVVGTPSYMSPEQAQGQPLDHRSDIYSLGVMLFEMTTGQRPFESDTPYSIAVLQVTARPPSPRSLKPELPAAVEDVILKTMSKKREERYNSAAKLAEAFKSAADVPASAFFDTQPGFPRPEALRPVTTLPPVSTPPPPASAPASSVVYTPPPPSSSYPIPPVKRNRPRRGGNLLVNMGLGALIGCGLLILIVLIAAVIISGILRGIGAQPTATPVPAVVASVTKIAQVATATCPADTICDAPTPSPSHTPIPAVAPPTNTPSAAQTEVIAVGQRDTPEPLADGTIVYFAERSNNFDIYRINLTTRVEFQLTSAVSSELYPAVSPDGAQIAFMSDADGDYDIYVMDSDGHNTHRLTSNNVTDRTPSWSPDGQWIVFSSDTRGDGGDDLYEIHPDGSGLKPLFSDDGRNTSPVFSKDGQSIYFVGGSISDGTTWEIKRLDLTSNQVTTLTHNTVMDWSPALMPDGSLIYDTEGDGHAAIAEMKADGSGSHVLYDGEGYEWGAEFSPSGSLITFTSDASGRDEIYVMNADGSNIRPVTNLGGMGAVWVK